MSELKLTGTIKAIFEPVAVTDTFTKREFVIETDDKYPQTVKFEATQSYCDQLDQYKEGQEVNVHFNVRGREWTNKEGKTSYFVSLNAWRVESVTQQQKAVDAATAPSTSNDDSHNDELPF